MSLRGLLLLVALAAAGCFLASRTTYRRVRGERSTLRVCQAVVSRWVIRVEFWGVEDPPGWRFRADVSSAGFTPEPL